MANVESVKRGVRKERKGVVVSKSGDKTIVVRVDRRLMFVAGTLPASFHFTLWWGRPTEWRRRRR